MPSLRVLNPNAEELNKSAAIHMNINTAKGLQDVLKANLGPKGSTTKKLVGETGDIKLTTVHGWEDHLEANANPSQLQS